MAAAIGPPTHHLAASATAIAIPRVALALETAGSGSHIPLVHVKYNRHAYMTLEQGRPNPTSAQTESPAVSLPMPKTIAARPIITSAVAQTFLASSAGATEAHAGTI